MPIEHYRRLGADTTEPRDERPQQYNEVQTQTDDAYIKKEKEKEKRREGKGCILFKPQREQERRRKGSFIRDLVYVCGCMG